MLERLYSLDLIEKKPMVSFLMGFAYAVIGIALAAILFKKDPALVTVAFIALLLYPTVTGMLKREEEKVGRQKTIIDILHLRMHRKVVSRYLLMFLGVLLAYSFFSIVLPSLATNTIFENQIRVLFGNLSGNAAVLDANLFSQLFTHNLKVMGLAFFTAFLIGDGALFLLVWNASVWGTIFGTLAKTAALSSALNPFILFGLVLLIVLPHLILETCSYILAATAGGVTSKALVKEKKSVKIKKLLISSLLILAAGVIILAIGMFIEQYVLANNDLYRNIIGLSTLT